MSSGFVLTFVLFDLFCLFFYFWYFCFDTLADLRLASLAIGWKKQVFGWPSITGQTRYKLVRWEENEATSRQMHKCCCRKCSSNSKLRWPNLSPTHALWQLLMAWLDTFFLMSVPPPPERRADIFLFCLFVWLSRHSTITQTPNWVTLESISRIMSDSLSAKRI